MKTAKVLHVTTNENDACGIAKYQLSYIDVMKDTANKIFRPSLNKIKLMNGQEFNKLKKRLINELREFDILHIQHEFSFFSHNQFVEMVHCARLAGKKVITTVHTSPSIALRKPRLDNIWPRTILRFARHKKHVKNFHKFHTQGFLQCNLIIVHNEETKHTLIQLGVPEDFIFKVTIPVPVLNNEMPQSTKIAHKLNKQTGDIIISNVGFINRHKGIFETVKALKLLPDNYKLAILGGVHPLNNDFEILDDLADLIIKLGLQKRVFISGYVEDDRTLNSYIRECDISVFPYDITVYYGSSSAAVNLALANRIPVVAYPIPSFKEINQEYNELILCNTPDYKELAKEVSRVNAEKQINRIEEFAQAYSLPVMAEQVEKKYTELAAVFS